jgi:hypothetical protein
MEVAAKPAERFGEAEPRVTFVPGGSLGRRSRRRGSATIDYFLLICIVLPLAAFMMLVAPRAMRSVYDLLTVMVAWPFM